jgi:hypothetical protein
LRTGARCYPLICCCSRGPLCSLAKSSRSSPSQLNTQQTTGFSSRQILSGRLSNHFHRLLAFIRSLSPVHLWPLASTSASSHEGSQPSPSQLNSTHQQTSDHDNYRLEGCIIITVVFLRSGTCCCPFTCCRSFGPLCLSREDHELHLNSTQHTKQNRLQIIINTELNTI